MAEVNNATRAKLFVTDYNVRDMFGSRQAPELELTDMLATARAEGYLAGLEGAAKVCDERFKRNDTVHDPDDPMYGAALNRCAEAEACAFDIRALAKEGGR